MKGVGGNYGAAISYGAEQLAEGVVFLTEAMTLGSPDQ